ncbi:mitochondrial transcription rescue factor 1-like [Haliotis rufescens]|uniref:mitochondrial transcription rescue factor 1-like n=1 Tax=Haliotis rufescens TaxID=6454 RepID=UPI00201FAD66|nr:mitochondrial transcription rescue factor 1-like [Haliotis rufescens]
MSGILQFFSMPSTRILMNERKHIFNCLMKHRLFVPASGYKIDNNALLSATRRQCLRPLHSQISLTAGQRWGVSKFLTPSVSLSNGLRGYAKKKSKNKADSSSDSDSDEEEDSEDEDEDDDDITDDGGSVMKLHVRSLRTDSILSKGMNTGREKIDKLFLANRLRLNGNVLLKKSKQLVEGDYVDMIIQNAEDETKVKRLKVLKILGEKTRTDKHAVKVQVWRKAFDPTDDGQSH